MAGDEIVEMRPDWSRLGEVPLAYANTFVSQLGMPVGPDALPDGIVIAFGTVSPPLLLGTEQQNRNTVDNMGGMVSVDPIARIALSRDRCLELLGIIQTAIAQHDQITQGQVHHG